MFWAKIVHLILGLVLYSSVTVFGQWSAANSGTTNNLNRGYLLDSGTAFAVGDAGTILKSTDAGVTWAPLTSGTTNPLQGVYFFDATQGVAVGEQGLILRTTDGGEGWQVVTSGVKDALRSVSLSGTLGFVAGQNSIFEPYLGATTDGGANWAFHDFHFDKNEGGGTDVFFFNQKTGVMSGFVFDGRGAIARTTDGGMNWSTLFFDQPIQGLDFPQMTSGFAVGWGGTILHSTDAGVTWNDQTSGTSAN